VKIDLQGDFVFASSHFPPQILAIDGPTGVLLHNSQLIGSSSAISEYIEDLAWLPEPKLLIALMLHASSTRALRVLRIKFDRNQGLSIEDKKWYFREY
jgi:hypothetical protein